MFDFKGKSLLLTGANGGITRSIAKTFYDLGADMVLTDLNGPGMEAYARELDPSGNGVTAVKVDITRSRRSTPRSRCASRSSGSSTSW